MLSWYRLRFFFLDLFLKNSIKNVMGLRLKEKFESFLFEILFLRFILGDKVFFLKIFVGFVLF